MSLESNQKQGNSDLLELPPSYSEVETFDRVPDYQNSRNGVSNGSANDGRNVNESRSRSTDRDCHPASFLFGIPIIRLLARIAVGLERSFRGYHHGHHGNHENYWGNHRHHSHHHNHHHGFDMNPFNNHHHHHSSHMNPFGY